jgi:hypothetical protein
MFGNCFQPSAYKEAGFISSFKDFSMSEAVPRGKNLRTKSTSDDVFLATTRRKDKLLSPVMLVFGSWQEM